MTTLCLDPSDPRLAPRLEEDFPREVVALVEEEIQSRLLPLLHLLLPSSHQLNRRQAHPHLLRLGDMVRELQVRPRNPLQTNITNFQLVNNLKKSLICSGKCGGAGEGGKEILEGGGAGERGKTAFDHTGACENIQLTSGSENHILKVVAHLETLVKEHCLGCTAEHTSTTVNYLKV